MNALLYFKTVVGTFYIKKGATYYYPFYEDENLGQYESIVEAIEALSYNATLVWSHPEMGDPLDPSDLGIPDDISGWKPI